MSMKIDADECTACGDCASTCPNGAIRKQGAYYLVSADQCNECEGAESPQCQDACPARCIDYA